MNSRTGAFNVDDNLDDAQESGPIRYSAPLPDGKTYLLEQDFMQFAKAFEALPQDSQHPDQPSYYLYEETPLVALGAGVVTWTRRYAKLPDARDEFETFVYTFPGWIGGDSTITEDPRDPFTETIISRVRFEYFQPGVSPGISKPKDIQVYERFQVFAQGGRNFPSNVLGGATTPTKDQYISALSVPVLITPAESAFGVYRYVLIPAEKQLVAETSSVRRWIGNIYERKTRYVTAK
jgi:hypothetical protein